MDSRLMLSTALGDALEGIVLRRVDVAQIIDIGRHDLVSPAATTEQKALIG